MRAFILMAHNPLLLRCNLPSLTKIIDQYRKHNECWGGSILLNICRNWGGEICLFLLHWRLLWSNKLYWYWCLCSSLTCIHLRYHWSLSSFCQRKTLEFLPLWICHTVSAFHYLTYISPWKYHHKLCKICEMWYMFMYLPALRVWYQEICQNFFSYNSIYNK